jgi:signal transduction histidine kinase
MSLHRSLTVFMVVLMLIALSGAISLIVLPTYVHRAALDLQNGLNSVRLADDIQAELLNYSRTTDEAAQLGLEDALRRKLRQAARLVDSADEDAAYNDASRAVETHFTNVHSGRRDEANLNRAFGALERLGAINVQQAERSVQEAARWDRIGDWIGIGSAAFLLLAIAGVLLWLRNVAFRPVFNIRDAMKSFGEGARTARAPENGPEELRLIAAQFNDMANALTRQNENQLHFLAAVAHDLRNPINALRLSSHVISSDLTTLPGQLSDLMVIVDRQIEHLERMIGDLLDSSRIEAGQLELRIGECDARKLAQDTFDLFSPTSSKHHFVLHLPESQVLVQCDPGRIEQVLNNLISNAIKYSPEGGNIELHVRQHGDTALFEVTDHGIGIPAAELPYIFEPFRRVRGFKDDIPGVGLGLSVVRRIIQAHGGRIEVESSVGKGTKFRIYVPLRCVSAA